MNKSVISIHSALRSIIFGAVLLLLISCGSDKSEETYFQFGDELYTKSQVSSFLDEIYGDERIGRIFIWHPDYVEVPYRLYLSPEFNTEKIRTLFRQTLAQYNDLLPVKFKETDQGEPYRAMFAFVTSYDQIMDLEMAHYMAGKEEMTDEEYQNFWPKTPENDRVSLKKYGYVDENFREKLGVVNEFTVTKVAPDQKTITEEQINRILCTSFIGAERASGIIPTSCTTFSKKDSNRLSPVDLALLKALKHLSERITNLGETQAKKEVLDYFEQEYGTTRP